MSDGTVLVRQKICFVGHVLPPDSFVVPYNRPMDPEGMRGPPCSTTWETPRGWVARVNKDTSLVVIQLELPDRVLLSPNAITNF